MSNRRGSKQTAEDSRASLSSAQGTSTEVVLQGTAQGLQTNPGPQGCAPTAAQPWPHCSAPIQGGWGTWELADRGSNEAQTFLILCFSASCCLAFSCPEEEERWCFCSAPTPRLSLPHCSSLWLLLQSQHVVCGVLFVSGGWWQCQQYGDSSGVQPQAQKLGNCRRPVGEGQSTALHPNSWLGLAGGTPALGAVHVCRRHKTTQLLQGASV